MSINLHVAKWQTDFVGRIKMANAYYSVKAKLGFFGVSINCNRQVSVSFNMFV